MPAAADAAADWKHDAKVIALVTVAHFTSHVHVMLLPPMLGLVRSAIGVNYVEIGAALTAFNVVSADRKSTRLNSSHRSLSRMPSSA